MEETLKNNETTQLGIGGVSNRGFSIHPEEGKFNKCAGCYWEEISGKCLNKVHHEIDNELPQCGRLPIIYKHESGRVYHGA